MYNEDSTFIYNLQGEKEIKRRTKYNKKGYKTKEKQKEDLPEKGREKWSNRKWRNRKKVT